MVSASFLYKLISAPYNKNYNGNNFNQIKNIHGSKNFKKPTISFSLNSKSTN